MPDNNDSSPKEFQPKEITQTIAESVLKDDEFRKALGRRTNLLILTTTVIAGIKLAGGLSVVPWSATPLAGMTATFLISAIDAWIRSKRPTTIFYLCPEEQKFIAIKQSSPTRYRKMKSCSCGCRIVKKCPQGKHEIVSSDPNNPDNPPGIDGFCQFCDPAIPKAQRAFLPDTAGKLNDEPRQIIAGESK